jgi:hypothetical protein
MAAFPQRNLRFGLEEVIRARAWMPGVPASTGAATIATTCPFCQTISRDALAASPATTKLLDIAQLAAISHGAKTTGTDGTVRPA